MNQSQDLEEIRPRLRALLAAHPEIDFAYLFGSFADGLPHRDVDVGIFLRPESITDAVFDREMTLSVALTLALHTDIDVHVLNGAPLGFQQTVLRGEPLLMRDEQRLTDFIERVGWEGMEFAHHAEDYLREVLT